jgi:large subunit ribosomal protein L23
LVTKEPKKEKKEEVKNEVVKEVASGKVIDFSYHIIKEPYISEKATNLGQENKYTFRIYNNVNKQEIKKAVEGIYKVDVVSVNTIKIPPKKRRLGKTQGFKKGYTKAVVMIKEGQKIEFF